MASYSDVVKDDYGRPIPGVLVYVFTKAGALATLDLGEANPITTDAFGAFSFAAPDAVYALEYRFAGVTKRLDNVIVGEPAEFVGPPGTADNTYTDLAAFKASDIARKTASLVGVPGVADGRFNWTPGNFAGQADDQNIVKADSTPLSQGAWKRQDAAGIAYRQSTVETQLANLFVQITDYYRVPDGDDWGPALTRALAASSRIMFPPRSPGYRFSSQVSAILAADTIIDANGQRLIFEGGRVSLSSTLIASGRSLATNAARYAKSVTVNNAEGIQAGDLLFINTGIQPSTGWSDTKKDCVRIKGVSGSTLTLDAGLNFHYTTSDASLDVLIYRPAKLTLLRPRIEINQSNNSTDTIVTFFLTGLRDVEIQSPSVIGSYPFTRETNIYRSGFWLSRCWGGTIDSPYYEAVSYGAGAYGGSRNIVERNVSARYTHHSHLDMGDWASDYLLDGLFSVDSYQALNSHVHFRGRAQNFRVRNDIGLSNWRCCGGTLINGEIQSSVDDTAELPQFSNNTPAAGYEYINEDVDFVASDLTFDCPNRTNKTPFGPRYARTAYFTRVVSPTSALVGLFDGEVGTLILGSGNEFGPNRRGSPELNLVKATSIRADSPPGLVPLVASAATISIPAGFGGVFVTGTTNVSTISPSGHTGRTVTLIFTDALTVTDGGNLALQSDFAATNGDTLTLICDGSAWFEIARSAN